MTKRRPSDRRRSLAADERGQVLIEYLVILVMTGIGLVLTVGPDLGPRIVGEYGKRRALLYAPYP